MKGNSNIQVRDRLVQGIVCHDDPVRIPREHETMAFRHPKTGAERLFARGRNRRTGLWTLAAVTPLGSPLATFIERNCSAYSVMRSWQVIPGNMERAGYVRMS